VIPIRKSRRTMLRGFLGSSIAYLSFDLSVPVNHVSNTSVKFAAQTAEKDS
jgi:hypothetical protein